MSDFKEFNDTYKVCTKRELIEHAYGFYLRMKDAEKVSDRHLEVIKELINVLKVKVQNEA